MKHGDAQQTFDTGAKRDTHSDKLRYDLITPWGLARLAKVYTDGSKHYGDRNWEKGMPLSRCVASMERHLMAFKQRDNSEDHLAQMVWNGMAILHYQEMMAQGVLPRTLDDLPKYEPKGDEWARISRVVPVPKYATDNIEDESGSVVGTTDKHSTYPGKSYIDTREGLVEVNMTNDHIDLHKMAPAAYDDRKDIVALDLLKLGCSPAIARQIAEGVTFSVCNGDLRKWVYIAGPMRGCKGFNFGNFDACRDRLIAKGFNVINPADMSRAEALKRNPDKEDSDMQLTYAIRDFWSLAYIRSKCSMGDAAYQKAHPVTNAIALLPGWARSTGASAEFFVSKWLGLSVLDHHGNKHPDAHPEYISHHD